MTKKSIAPIVFLLSAFVTSCTNKPADVLQAAPPAAVVSDTIKLSPKAVERFNISTIEVADRADDRPLTSTGEIKADENRVFHINSLSNGRVIADNVMLGDVIRPGQTLAVVQNIEVAKIFGDYIHQAHDNELQVKLSETRLALTKKTLERMKLLMDEKIGSQKDFIKADYDVKLEQANLDGLKEHRTHLREEASSLLSAYGVNLPPGDTEHVESSSPIKTPRGGAVIKKNVTVGDVVNSTEPLYVVADLGHVWLDIAVYDQQLEAIRPGDRVKFASDSLPNHIFNGLITYIKPATEAASGTFVARAVLDNPKMDLKPGMLGQVTIATQRPERKPFLPDSAIQKYGKEAFVFLVRANGVYEKKTVEVGDHTGGGYFIDSGIKAGQEVVDKGSFTLKAEMLKGSPQAED